MNVNTLFYAGGDIEKKLSKLTVAQLEHLVQLKEFEIENYKRVIKNYDAKKMEKYGTPYLVKLNNHITSIRNVLSSKE